MEFVFAVRIGYVANGGSGNKYTYADDGFTFGIGNCTGNVNGPLGESRLCPPP